MSKFNKNTNVKVQPNSINLAGGSAFKESPELELISIRDTSTT